MMRELPVGKKEIKRRADGLSLVRAALVAIVMLVAWMLQESAGGAGLLYAANPLLFYLVLSGFLVVTFVFRLAHRRVAALEKLLYVEICFDVVLTSFVVRWTGGADSLFVFLYVVAIVSTSLLFSARGGFAIASLAALMFTAAAFGDRLAGPREFSETSRWLAAVSFFYLTAFLAAFLSAGVERLRVFSSALLENLVSGAAIVDSEGQVVFLNAVARDILGVSGRDRRLNAEVLFSTASGGNPVVSSLNESLSRQREQVEIRRQDGLTVPIGLTVSILKGRNGSLRGAVVSFVDLTDIKKLERQIRLRDRMAALGTMSAGLAHEIRNPLASLSGSAELLEHSRELEGDDQRLLSVIRRETTRLNQIVTAFLEYCREEPLGRQSVDVRLLLSEVIASVERFDDWTPDHRIEVEYLNGIPTLSGDPVQLRQCLLNLARNAAQAMPSGGTVRLVVHDTESESLAEIDVIDDGRGMTEDQITRAFDPFYSTRDGGTGLGLSVVHRIVEAHGGTVRIESTRGAGTAFHVRIPAWTHP